MAYAYCTNCSIVKNRHEIKGITIEKGLTYEAFIKKAKCPTCGCQTLIKESEKETIKLK